MCMVSTWTNDILESRSRMVGSIVRYDQKRFMNWNSKDVYVRPSNI